MTVPPDVPMPDRACRALLGTDIVAADRLSVASRSAVYRVVLPPPCSPNSVIVKLYTGPTRWKADKEHRIANVVAQSTRLSAPQVLGSGAVPGDDASAVIFEDLGTVTLGEAVRTGRRSRGQALRQLGGLLNAFHQLPRDAATSADETFGVRLCRLRRCLPSSLLAVTGATLSRLVELAEAREDVLCHGDLHFDNVLLPATDRCPGLVDFEQTALAIPEYDVAQSAVTCGALAPHDRSQIVAGYAGDLTDELITHLIVFHALRGWVYAAVRENRDVALWRSRLNTALDQSTASA